MKLRLTGNIFKVFLLFCLLYSACENDTITTNPPPPVTDTSLSNFNNLVMTEGSIASFITPSAADLYRGIVVTDSNRLKDINMVTNASLIDTTYYIATGDIFDNNFILIPGYKTRFKLIYANLTLEKIPDTDPVLLLMN